MGIGNFSSKLAFKATGLNIAGGFPQKFTYMNSAFISNHLDLYLYYFTKEDGLHSITNNPNSVYDQLISGVWIIGNSQHFLFSI